MTYKIYRCCVCNTILPYKPHRLVHQEYGVKRYHQFQQVDKYDFCNKCFKKFEELIIKKGEKE